MSDYNRGAYTPPSNDAPLAFDARRPVRGGSPAPVTLIISAVVLLVLIVGAWFIYKDGFRTDGEAPKTVGAVVTTPKTAPKEDDQPKNETGGLVIYNQEDGLPPADPTYAPPPETPLPRPAPPKVDSKPAPPPPEASLRPTQTPAPTPPAKPETRVVTAPPPPAATPNARGNFLVQVGAFSSAALADKGWSDAAAIAPGAAAGKGKKVETVESGGKTLYRTSVTGFPDRASAQDFCDRLKAAGKACFVR
ncbi:MAG: SPOR domain-containing protein [Caulobacter sp.]|nr:SPOR domain-containing protein [Caulobacter sp.]